MVVALRDRLVRDPEVFQRRRWLPNQVEKPPLVGIDLDLLVVGFRLFARGDATLLTRFVVLSGSVTHVSTRQRVFPRITYFETPISFLLSCGQAGVIA